MTPAFKTGHKKERCHISDVFAYSKVRIWTWSLNKTLKHFGNAAGAIPYSNLCNGHEGAKNKSNHMGKKPWWCNIGGSWNVKHMHWEYSKSEMKKMYYEIQKTSNLQSKTMQRCKNVNAGRVLNSTECQLRAVTDLRYICKHLNMSEKTVLKWQYGFKAFDRIPRGGEKKYASKNRNNNADFEEVVFFLFQIFHNSVYRHCG